MALRSSSPSAFRSHHTIHGSRSALTIQAQSFTRSAIDILRASRRSLNVCASLAKQHAVGWHFGFYGCSCRCSFGKLVGRVIKAKGLMGDAPAPPVIYHCQNTCRAWPFRRQTDVAAVIREES